MPSATTQSASRASARPAPPAIQKTPEAAIQAAMRRKFRGAAPGPAKHQAVKRLRPSCIATNESAKASPRSPKASGTDIDMKSPSSIEA